MNNNTTSNHTAV